MFAPLLLWLVSPQPCCLHHWLTCSTQSILTWLPQIPAKQCAAVMLLLAWHVQLRDSADSCALHPPPAVHAIKTEPCGCITLAVHKCITVYVLQPRPAEHCRSAGSIRLLLQCHTSLTAGMTPVATDLHEYNPHLQIAAFDSMPSCSSCIHEAGLLHHAGSRCHDPWWAMTIVP